MHKACSEALGSPHVHAAAKAKAAPTGTLPRPRAPHGHAAEGTGGLNLRTERGKEF